MSKQRHKAKREIVPAEISTVEAATLLKVQVRQVQRLIKRGKLRARKLPPGGLRSPWLVVHASVYDLLSVVADEEWKRSLAENRPAPVVAQPKRKRRV